MIYRERLLNEEPLTLREIGDKYGISRERVRQIEERVKKKLKTYLSKEFKDVNDIVGRRVDRFVASVRPVLP